MEIDRDEVYILHCMGMTDTAIAKRLEQPFHKIKCLVIEITNDKYNQALDREFEEQHWIRQ